MLFEIIFISIFLLFALIFFAWAVYKLVFDIKYSTSKLIVTFAKCCIIGIGLILPVLLYFFIVYVVALKDYYSILSQS